ncbi:MAG: hypothetical protein V1776_03065 [Candidatus Diapherotrites archaeon]
MEPLLSIDRMVINSLHSFSWQDVGVWFSYAIILAVYVILIWNFYRSVARRDIFARTFTFHHPGIVGFLEDFILAVLRLVKYGVFFPVFSFLWFGGFVVLLLVVAQNQTVSQVVLLSIAIVSGARILSYYNQDTAQELAKIIPMVVLGIALVEPDFFELNKVVSRLETIPTLWNSLLPFILYLSLLELTLRILLYTKWMILGKSVNEDRIVKQK